MGARRFVSEAIRPEAGSFDAGAMAAGAPGLPAAFRWRDELVRIAALRRHWRTTGPCRHGSGERYVRRHWFEVTDTEGRVMTLYFERQTGRRRPGPQRWWLYTVD